MATVFSEYNTLGGIVRCYVNDKVVASVIQTGTDFEDKPNKKVAGNTLVLQTTLQLNKNDKVSIKLRGTFNGLDLLFTTYFEGRLISIINK